MKNEMRNPVEMPQISSRVLHVFQAFIQRHLRKNFHSFRILKNGLPVENSTRPVVIFFNHAAWWDPLVCLSLARQFFPHKKAFGPIDAAMLERYGFFKHLGFFPLEQNSSRGAVQFLRTSHTILQSPENSLWLSPQGRFADVRQRPLEFRAGLGALAARETHASFIPLSIEYTFWTESRQEILVSFGPPINPSEMAEKTSSEWTQIFADSLENAQNNLAASVCRRDLSEWIVLNRGTSGTTKIYDTWRWLRARLRGESFSSSHSVEVPQ